MDVGVVGLGTIARTHLEVLGSLEQVRVVLGVDPGPGTAPLPTDARRVGSLDEALAAGPAVDLLVLATPTPTHVGLTSRALEATSAQLLVEKPFGTSTAELDELEARHGRDVLDRRVRVAHHFAFSPEVLRAAELVAAHPEWGPAERIVSSFNDAYAPKTDEQLDSYVTAWVDSGPNQLSLLSRFVTGLHLVERDEADGGLRCSARVGYDGGEALLVANWLAGDSSKQTSLHLRGGVEVRMDHTSMTVLVVEDGRLVEHVGYEGEHGRKFAHYDGLYRALLADGGGETAGYGLAREVAAVLGAPGGAEPVPGGRRTTWSRWP